MCVLTVCVSIGFGLNIIIFTIYFWLWLDYCVSMSFCAGVCLCVWVCVSNWFCFGYMFIWMYIRTSIYILVFFLFVFYKKCSWGRFCWKLLADIMVILFLGGLCLRLVWIRCHVFYVCTSLGPYMYSLFCVCFCEECSCCKFYWLLFANIVAILWVSCILDWYGLGTVVCLWWYRVLCCISFICFNVGI